MSAPRVMMCRYAVVKRELVGTAVLESCLLFFRGQQGGIRRQAEMESEKHL